MTVRIGRRMLTCGSCILFHHEEHEEREAKLGGEPFDAVIEKLCVEREPRPKWEGVASECPFASETSPGSGLQQSGLERTMHFQRAADDAVRRLIELHLTPPSRPSW